MPRASRHALVAKPEHLRLRAASPNDTCQRLEHALPTSFGTRPKFTPAPRGGNVQIGGRKPNALAGLLPQSARHREQQPLQPTLRRSDDPVNHIGPRSPLCGRPTVTVLEPAEPPISRCKRLNGITRASPARSTRTQFSPGAGITAAFRRMPEEALATTVSARRSGQTRCSKRPRFGHRAVAPWPMMLGIALDEGREPSPAVSRRLLSHCEQHSGHPPPRR